MSQRAGQGAAGTDALPDLPPITEHESTVHASPLMSTPAESVLEKSDEDVVAAAERQRMMRYIEWENKLENAHIYMWIAKDFSWSSNNYYLGLIAGTAALVWSFLIAAISIYRRDWEDFYMNAAVTLWLGGNYVWMCGELTIPLVPNTDDGVPVFGNNDKNTLVAFHMFVVALCFLALHYCVLRPLEITKSNKHMTDYYIQHEFYPRFPSYFKNIKQYEYLHTLCWIGKDLCWNRLWPAPWIFFFFFTFGVAIDFVFLSYAKGYWVDCAHYCAQLLWVTANFAWGYGEMFHKQFDSPVALDNFSELALRTGRWWAEWILLFAYVPIVAMFVGLVYSWYADSKVADSSGSGSEFDAETAHVEELSITGDDVSVYTMCKNGSVISASPGGRRSRVLSVGSRSRSSNERDGNRTDMAAIGRSLVNPLQSGQKDLRSSSPLQSPRSPHEEL